MLSLICGILFSILGIIGGLAAYSRWWRLQSDFFLYQWLWGSHFTLAQIITFWGYIGGGSEFRAKHDSLFMYVSTLVLLSFLGAIFWFYSFVLHLMARVVQPNFGTLKKSYDIGDGLMARGRFAEAVEAYRQAIQEDAQDTEALVRMCRALEAGGKFGESARELEHAYSETSKNKFDPPLRKEDYQARLSQIVFMLGDLYQHKLNHPSKAQQLYSTALLQLQDHPDAKALRQRLDGLGL